MVLCINIYKKKKHIISAGSVCVRVQCYTFDRMESMVYCSSDGVCGGVQAAVVRVGIPIYICIGWYLVMRTKIGFLWDSKSP